MLKPKTNQYWGLFIFAIMLWGFAGSEIFKRAVVELNGEVVRSDTSCVQPYNNRCSTIYVVENSKGISTTYIAGPTDKALRRRLPIGTIIVKQKWRLAYTINGIKIDDFPIIFYGGLLVLGVVCFCGWVALRLINREVSRMKGPLG